MIYAAQLKTEAENLKSAMMDQDPSEVNWESVKFTGNVVAAGDEVWYEYTTDGQSVWMSTGFNVTTEHPLDEQ